MRLLRFLALLVAGLTGAASLSAQPALRASVIAGGAADATGDAWRVRGTVGQTSAARASRRPFVITQGFWPAVPTRTPVTLALFPDGTPTQVVAGQKLVYRAEFSVSAGGPSDVQYWATNTEPDGTIRTVLGPISLLLTPPTVQSVWILQIVDPRTPPGAQTYTMRAGTYPSIALATDAFGYTVLPGGQGGVLSATREAPWPPQTDGRPTSRDAGTSLAFADDRRDGAPWLAFDADGVLLLPGHVMDLRADSAVAAKDGPDTMIPDEAQATATDLPTVVTLGAPFPNPARDRATIRFGLPTEGPVRLTVYDALGRRVAELADGTHAAGWHTATLGTAGLAGGVYVVRLDAGDRSVTQRLTVAR